MTTVRLTLQPASAFGTPLLGEILFGQMCWAFVRLYGEERLADLLEGYVDGRPFAVLSDAFPSGHVPLPTLPNYLWLFRLFGETGSSMVPWSRSELAREKDAAKFPS